MDNCLWIISSSILSILRGKEYKNVLKTRIPGATFCSQKLRAQILKDVKKIQRQSHLHVILSLGGNDFFPGRLLKAHDKWHYHFRSDPKLMTCALKDIQILIEYIADLLKERSVTYKFSFFPLFPRVPTLCCDNGLCFPYEKSLKTIREFEIGLKKAKTINVFQLQECLAKFITISNIKLEKIGITNDKKLKIPKLCNKNKVKILFFRAYEKRIFGADKVHFAEMGEQILANTLDIVVNTKRM